MAGGLHATGEEAILDDFFEESLTKPASVEVGLYHDGDVSGDTTNGDQLADDSDSADINTRTNGANGTVTVSFGTTDFTTQEDTGTADADTFAEIVSDPQYDLSGVTSGTIDAYYVEIDFTSDTTGDGSAQTHLLFTGDLDQAYDAGQVDNFTLDGAGLNLS